jgi:DNA-binding MarR family transcriptional regulator
MMQIADGGRGFETEALTLLKELRKIDALIGIKNSRIAFDVVLLFYEAGLREEAPAHSVDQMADLTGYSGPTIRLVLKRLISHGHIVSGRRLGKTQFYALTQGGRAAFHAYVTALAAFRAGAPPPG